jgi:hypothetical protein
MVIAAGFENVTAVPHGEVVGLGVGVPGVTVGLGVPGVGVTPPPQLPRTLNTRCMFGKPMAAVVVGVVIPHAAALR